MFTRSVMSKQSKKCCRQAGCTSVAAPLGLAASGDVSGSIRVYDAAPCPRVGAVQAKAEVAISVRMAEFAQHLTERLLDSEERVRNVMSQNAVLSVSLAEATLINDHLRREIESLKGSRPPSARARTSAR